MNPMPYEEEPEPEPRRYSTRRIIGVGCAGVAACILLGVAIGLATITTTGTNDKNSDKTPSPVTITSPTAKKAASKEVLKGPATTIAPGTYLVGTDVAAGTYRTKGATPQTRSGMCFWTRSTDATGELDSVIAGEIVKGAGIVTIKAGEYFKTSECQNWVRTP